MGPRPNDRFTPSGEGMPGGGGFSDSGMRDAAATLRPTTRAGTRSVGERVRALRVAAGLTQSELAGERFSKEYVSQIERGKTTPTDATIAWLADRLGVDEQFLRHGVSADARSRVEARLAQAEALSEAHRDEDAVAAFRAAREEIRLLGSPELELRALAGEGWALQELGASHDAIARVFHAGRGAPGMCGHGSGARSRTNRPAYVFMHISVNRRNTHSVRKNTHGNGVLRVSAHSS